MPAFSDLEALFAAFDDLKVLIVGDVMVDSYLWGKSTPEGQVISNSSDLSMYILNDAFVAAVSGDAFGADECIRFSFAASDEKLTEAMDRLKISLAKLK